MTRMDFASAYEPIPQALEYRMKHALAQLDDAPATKRRPALRTALIVAALVLALCGVAYAVYESVTADWFGWFYGGSWKEDIQRGDIAPMGQSQQLGEVTYTVQEMVYKTEGGFEGLYGVVRIAPVEGANVVLVPADLSVHDPAGYLLHYGETGQPIADDAPSYAELATQRGAKLLIASVDVKRLLVNGEDCLGGCYGLSWLSQADGSVLMTLEMTDGVPRAERYELELSLSSDTVTPDGWPDESDGASRQQDWVVTVTPDTKGE